MLLYNVIHIPLIFFRSIEDSKKKNVETGFLLIASKMGRRLKIGSLSNGFITLAGGSLSFHGTKIHRLLTVIMGYFQALN